MNYKIQQENIQNTQNTSIPTICTNLNAIINDLKKIEDECKKISLQNHNHNRNQTQNLFLNISTNTIPAEQINHKIIIPRTLGITITQIRFFIHRPYIIFLSI